MYSLCQRCKDEHTNSWNVKQAEFHVGRIDHWKVQLCADCHTLVEQAVLAALKPATKPDAIDPVAGIVAPSSTRVKDLSE
jgi:hypothetical protein